MLCSLPGGHPDPEALCTVQQHLLPPAAGQPRHPSPSPQDSLGPTSSALLHSLSSSSSSSSNTPAISGGEHPPSGGSGGGGGGGAAAIAIIDSLFRCHRSNVDDDDDDAAEDEDRDEDDEEGRGVHQRLPGGQSRQPQPRSAPPDVTTPSRGHCSSILGQQQNGGWDRIPDPSSSGGFSHQPRVISGGYDQQPRTRQESSFPSGSLDKQTSLRSSDCESELESMAADLDQDQFAHPPPQPPPPGGCRPSDTAQQRVGIPPLSSPDPSLSSIRHGGLE